MPISTDTGTAICYTLANNFLSTPKFYYRAEKHAVRFLTAVPEFVKAEWFPILLDLADNKDD